MRTLFAGKNRVVLGLVAFTAGAAVFMGYLFNESGVRMPFTESGYQVSFETDDVDNLVSFSDVQIAGVTVGTVERIHNQDGHAVVTVSLDEGAPLHEGATVRVGAKSAVGESYVDVRDGHGSALPSGARLPASSVKPSVTLRDVLDSLDSETRQALGRLVRSAGLATDGTKSAIGKAMTGLGHIGREGHSVVDAIAAQSEDLTALARQTSIVLSALNTNQGQIATMVQNAQRLTAATNGQRQTLYTSMQQLPGVMTSAQSAAGELRRLSGALSPVAADLKSAAPHLSAALRELPRTADDLRGLVPALDGTLRRAPATLERVPRFGQDVKALIPPMRTLMSNLNPMLSYMKPYGHDMSAFFANFGAMLKYTDEAGIHFFRLAPVQGNEAMVKGSPQKLPNVLTYKNPYPAPGEAGQPGGREFTKLHPQPK